jgi:hypothetical protein
MEAKIPPSSIDKSSRHSAIIGKCAEYLICSWLSRSGFEVAVVDHTGIDLVAYRRKTDLRIGVSVKSRLRTKRPNDSVNVFEVKTASDKRKTSRDKVKEACNAFSCEAWIGIYVETDNGADIYLTSVENYDEKYCTNGKKKDDWKMTKKYREKYRNDPDVQHVRISFDTERWF